jgi:gluconolactonase
MLSGPSIGRRSSMPIEQVSPELERIVSVDTAIEELGTGYGGGEGPAEGPLWWKEGGYLLFSDIHNNRRMKWSPEDGVTVFREPTDRANGLTRDVQGRLVACEHDSRRVTRLEHDGSITVIANSFKGRQLNRPNDVVVKSDGSIYFTDPWTLPRAQEQWDLDFAGVYRVSPDLGRLTLLVQDFITPNGLAFSPDESILYINDSRRGHIRAFDLAPTGTLAMSTDRVLCDLRGEGPGVPDGMKVDVEGNVYCGGAGGIWVMDPSGEHLGTIVHGQPASTNMAWGGEDWKTLYFTTRNTLGRIRLKIPGIQVPPGA